MEGCILQLKDFQNVNVSLLDTSVPAQLWMGTWAVRLNCTLYSYLYMYLHFTHYHKCWISQKKKICRFLLTHVTLQKKRYVSSPTDPASFYLLHTVCFFSCTILLPCFWHALTLVNFRRLDQFGGINLFSICYVSSLRGMEQSCSRKKIKTVEELHNYIFDTAFC